MVGSLDMLPLQCGHHADVFICHLMVTVPTSADPRSESDRNFVALGSWIPVDHHHTGYQQFGKKRKSMLFHFPTSPLHLAWFERPSDPPAPPLEHYIM